MYKFSQIRNKLPESNYLLPHACMTSLWSSILTARPHPLGVGVYMVPTGWMTDLDICMTVLYNYVVARFN